jgi:uncharacterized membrane protein YdjX (TVP38/TMEM64 family)
MADGAIPGKKLPLKKLAVIAGVAGLVLAGAAVALGGDPRMLLGETRGLLDALIVALRDAGPAIFFTAMAVLPACGFPMLVFLLTAGPAFAPSLGMPWVVVLALLAMVVNFMGSYFLARQALRPLLERLMQRLGYRLPEVGAGDALDMIIILRVTPGVPYFVQNYLLGLARAPVVQYAVASSVLSLPVGGGLVVFGRELQSGRAGAMIATAGVLLALFAALHLVRRHYGAKRKGAVKP